MARGWQHWLSPRPLRRTGSASESRILATHDAVLFEFLEDKDRSVVRETHYIDNKLVRNGLSGPPLHIHLTQTEYFQVESGVIGIMKNGQELVMTKNDGIIEIPPGARHRFWAHTSGKEDLVFKVWAEPQDLDHGFGENLLRNLMGYEQDCEKEGIKPSIFQMILMLYNSSTIATPPFWMPIWILNFMQYVLAYWVAAALLGYEAHYPEYSKTDEHNSRHAKKSI